ncbi:MAG TPA: phosphocholine cytidylyltransferase family protein [Actinomycetales bacterium]|nr:phosphocholine cytidylyltransferase family protein [Actinomycetales bacterium]
MSGRDTVQVVILAAGLGSRLGRPLPKPLTRLDDGRTILERQVCAVRASLGPRVPITVVVGFMAETVMVAAPHGVGFVHNRDFAVTNTAKSLLAALTQIPAGGVLWLNGDVVFDTGVLDRGRPHMREQQTLVWVNTAAVAEEEVKYSLDPDGFIRELSKIVVGGLGEAVGINFVSAADRAVLTEHLRACGPQDYFERGLETAIAESGMLVRPLDISGLLAVEIDDEEDLARANGHLLESVLPSD